MLLLLLRRIAGESLLLLLERQRVPSPHWMRPALPALWNCLS
jgi:hypothetical protein